jgi:hypothetical protein
MIDLFLGLLLGFSQGLLLLWVYIWFKRSSSGKMLGAEIKTSLVFGVVGISAVFAIRDFIRVWDVYLLGLLGGFVLGTLVWPLASGLKLRRKRR